MHQTKHINLNMFLIIMVYIVYYKQPHRSTRADKLSLVAISLKNTFSATLNNFYNMWCMYHLQFVYNAVQNNLKTLILIKIIYSNVTKCQKWPPCTFIAVKVVLQEFLNNEYNDDRQKVLAWRKSHNVFFVMLKVFHII